MKAVILAGGLGARISEETQLKPKPMVEIGGKPILWHVMKIYSAHGINDFIICCGYKGYVIKEYFANYFLHVSDITFDMQKNKMEVHVNGTEPWRVTLVDTGEKSGTGGRLKRVQPYLGDEDFCFTYGDGLSNVNIGEVIAFHKKQKVLATLTAVQMPGRYGALNLDKNDKVITFQEKPRGDTGWINGGFFVLSSKVTDYIDGDLTFWEREPMERLASQGQLAAYLHHGFWHPMDTLKDRMDLEAMWNSGDIPWKVW
jgi:glucose-1-phosphate cytidylyltransferase